MLTLYRRLIELRRAEPALAVGAYAMLGTGEDLIAYTRQTGKWRLLIALNFASAERAFDLTLLSARATVLLSTHLDRSREALGAKLRLRADEGVIIELA